MADIQYLNYGDLQIELLALMNNLADNVQNYVLTQPWSKKRKELFMSAYLDLINKGVLGASNSTGQWVLNVGENLDLDSKSKKEKEMYQEAAYFILQLMDYIKSEKDNSEKANLEKDKTPFDFNDSFTKHVSKSFGGRDFHIGGEKDDWNYRDERDEKGLRGRTNRSKKLADLLDSYSKSLQDGVYEFKDSPYSDLNDIKTKLANVSAALRNPEISTNDLRDSLDTIGLRMLDWLNDGSGDITTDENGNQVTYGQLIENNNKLAKQKALEELLILQQLNQKQFNQEAAKMANRWDHYRFYRHSTGKPIQNQLGNEVNYLKLLANKEKLTLDEILEVIGAFKLFEKQGSLSPLSKLEIEKFAPSWKNRVGNLRKINGIEGIYWDSVGQRVVHPYKKGLTSSITDSQDIFNQNSPEALAKENKLKAANRELSKGWEAEDFLRMGAMALDITGAIAAWGGPYGMAASGLLGLTSLGTNMAADIADESLSKWDVAKNAGVNLGLAAVGIVPGLGLASRTGKWLTTIAKWAPRLLTIQALKDTPEVYASIKKAVDTPSKVTNQDWKNIAYGLSIAAGLSRGAKGIVNNRKYKPTVTKNTETETFITTKSGNKIKATLELVDVINKAGRKGGNDKANEELRKLPGAKADDEVNFNFKTGVKGKVDLTNKIKLDSSTKNVGQSPEVLRYSRALSIKNIRDKAAHPFLSKYLPTNYDIYLSAARVSTPNINIADRVRQIWNPVPNRPFKGTNQGQHFSNNSTTSTSTNSTTPISTGANARPKLPILSKEDSKELLSTLRGKNFSTNETKEAPMTVKGFGDIYGTKDPFSGKYSLEFKLRDGTEVKIDPKDIKDIKSETLNVLRKDIMKKIDSQIPKELRSRIKFELIKQLKENGYLKQGGTIDKQRIQRYKEFINK